MKKIIILAVLCSACIRVDMSKINATVEELKKDFQQNRNQVSEIQKVQNQILTNSYENNIQRINYNVVPSKIDSIWNARFNPKPKN